MSAYGPSRLLTPVIFLGQLSRPLKADERLGTRRAPQGVGLHGRAKETQAICD